MLRIYLHRNINSLLAPSAKPFCQKRREHSLVRLLDGLLGQKKIELWSRRPWEKQKQSASRQVLSTFLGGDILTIRQHGLLLPGCDSAIGEKGLSGQLEHLKYLRFREDQCEMALPSLLEGRGARKSSGTRCQDQSKKGGTGRSNMGAWELRCLFIIT